VKNRILTACVDSDCRYEAMTVSTNSDWNSVDRAHASRGAKSAMGSDNARHCRGGAGHAGQRVLDIACGTGGRDFTGGASSPWKYWR
jgi:hypothetical protein